MWVLYLCLLVLFELVADILVKEYSLGKGVSYAAAALTCYVVANAWWCFAMKNNSQLAVMANIFSVSTGILAALVGAMAYGEVLLPRQWAGVALGCAALVLLFDAGV